MAETHVDKARRLVRIGARVYELRPLPFPGYDVYEGSEHVGSFAIEGRTIKPEQLRPARTAGEQVAIIARTWVDAFPENEPPW